MQGKRQAHEGLALCGRQPLEDFLFQVSGEHAVLHHCGGVSYVPVQEQPDRGGPPAGAFVQRAQGVRACRALRVAQAFQLGEFFKRER